MVEMVAILGSQKNRRFNGFFPYPKIELDCLCKKDLANDKYVLAGYVDVNRDKRLEDALAECHHRIAR